MNWDLKRNLHGNFIKMNILNHQNWAKIYILTDLKDKPKNGLYPIQTRACQREGHKEVAVRSYWRESLAKPLLDHAKSMKKFYWIVLTIVILWTFSLPGTSRSNVVSKCGVHLWTAMLLLGNQSLSGNFLCIKGLQERK